MDRAELIDCFRMMCLVRIFEEEVLKLTSAGLVPGFVHPYTGQEAIAAGVLAGREPDEWVVTYYRCHGHALASGCDPEAVLREILTRGGGLCGGKGGSMHLADKANRFLGATSVVAAQLPMAAGVAMTEQRDGSGRAVLVFCGDGALGAGVAYETMTIARTLRLPLLIVCEDNGWQDHTPTNEVSSLSPARLCAGLELPHREVDGNDLVEVAGTARELLAACRSGSGPAVLVAHTYLLDFHAQSGSVRPPEYRPAPEVELWRARDPLVRMAELLDDPDAIRAEVAELVAGVVARAVAAPPPDPATVAASVTAAVWSERAW